MISKIKTLINFLLSFTSVLKLNFSIFSHKIYNSKKKVIFINHPSRSLTLNNKNYLGNYLIIIAM